MKSLPILAAVSCLGATTVPAQQFDIVTSHTTTRIGVGELALPLTGFSGDADFGSSIAALDDFDGDGRPDLAVGEPGASVVERSRGAVRVLRIDSQGEVRSENLLSSDVAMQEIPASSRFGSAMATIGDLDGNGSTDLSVGAPGDPTFGWGAGAVHLVFFDDAGTVLRSVKLEASQPGLASLQSTFELGRALAPLGDIDGDGNIELAVGGIRDDGSTTPVGIVWIVSLSPDGGVHGVRSVTAGDPALSGPLTDGFASALATIGDLDQDGLPELAVGVPDSGGGAVWVLSFDADVTLRDAHLIELGSGALASETDEGFGLALGPLSDFDGDGIPDLAVGSRDSGAGALWMLYLNRDGSVHGYDLIANNVGRLPLDATGRFASSIFPLGELSRDGTTDLLVGQPGFSRTGAFLELRFTAGRQVEDVQWYGNQLISLGREVVSLGDLDGDGTTEVAMGDSSGGDVLSRSGAVWIGSLGDDGSLDPPRKISLGRGLEGDLRSGDGLGSALTPLGDLDGDGHVDLAVGARGDSDAVTFGGAVWLLFLDRTGEVGMTREISATAGGFGGVIEQDDVFGEALACVGDLDGDGVTELAVGAPGRNGSSRGTVWILFLDRDGSVKAERRLDETTEAELPLEEYDFFGSSLASVGDLDGDGRAELAVGAPGRGKRNQAGGGVFLLFLEADGSVRTAREILTGKSGFLGTPGSGAEFGAALASIGDINADGTPDLAVGSPEDDSTGDELGALWLLFLSPEGLVKGQRKLTRGFGSAFDELEPFGDFGTTIAALGDQGGDGALEVLVGAGAAPGSLHVLSLRNGNMLASVTSRNGAGVNPESLHAPRAPRAGTLFVAQLDAAGHDPGATVLLGSKLEGDGLQLDVGELLIDPSSLVFGLSQPHSGESVAFALPVPKNSKLVGLSFSLQGLVLGAPGPRLSNALDVVLGL